MIQLPTNTRMEEIKNARVDFCFGVTERPKRQIKIFMTDPEMGIHQITEDMSNYIPNSATGPFGVVSLIALSSNFQLIAAYANAEISGQVIVCHSNTFTEFSRQDTN